MVHRRTSQERLGDVLEAIEKVNRFLAGKNYANFATDAMLHDAVVRNLGIISEASRFLPGDVRALESNIPWRNIADMGNWLRHGYDTVSDETLWETIERDLPTLYEAVKRMLAAGS